MIKQDLNIVDFVKVFKRDRFVDDTLNHVKNIIAKNKETLKRRQPKEHSSPLATLPKPKIVFEDEGAELESISGDRPFS